MTLVFTRHTDTKCYELRPRGAAAVYVLRGVPDSHLVPQGHKPRFTLAADPAGTSPLAVIARKNGGGLVVLTPDHEQLAELRLPPRKKRWRRTYEIHLPHGIALRGREGTVPSLLLCLALLPLTLLYMVALTLSDSPAGTTTAPLRTAWKQSGKPFSRAALSESARGRFRIGREGLDQRVAYAQAVAKYWER